MRSIGATALLAFSALLATANDSSAAGPAVDAQVTSQLAGQLGESAVGFHGLFRNRYGYCGYSYARPQLYVGTRYPAYQYGWTSYRPYSYYGYASQPYYRPYIYSSNYPSGSYYRGYYGSAYAPYSYGAYSYGGGYSSYAYRPSYTYPLDYSRYGYYYYPSYSAFAYPYGYPGAASYRSYVYYGF